MKDDASVHIDTILQGKEINNSISDTFGCTEFSEGRLVLYMKRSEEEKGNRRPKLSCITYMARMQDDHTSSPVSYTRRLQSCDEFSRYPLGPSTVMRYFLFWVFLTGQAVEVRSMTNEA